MVKAAAVLPDFTNAVLNKRYQLTRMVGSGSFGVVYHAIDTHAPADSPACERAIKLISKANRHRRELAVFRHEAAMHMRASKHPNVVTLHSAMESKEYMMFVMDYCAGGSLAERVRTQGSYINDDEIRTTFLALVDAVAALHKDGIFHRDLKPSNILLNKDGSRIFIADFGMAGKEEFYAFRCGTPAYMAPELCHATFNHKPRRSAPGDVWALGIILLHMISGRVPWAEATPSHYTYAQFVRNPAYLLNCAGPDVLPLPISAGLNKILRRMLRANPAIRMDLCDVRRAVLALDSFFHDDDAVDADASSSSSTTSNSSFRLKLGRAPLLGAISMRSTLASEMDILRSWTLKRARRREEERSAAGATPVCAPSTSARTTSSSTGKSDSVGVELRVGCERKVVGERVRLMMSRVKVRFRRRQ